MQRGIKTYTTARAALVACLLCAALLFMMSGGLFGAFSTAAFALTTMPLYLLFTATLAGILPMSFCAALTVAALGLNGGVTLLFYGAVFLAPLTAGYAVCLTKKVAFWRTVALMAALQTAALLVIFLDLQRRTGGELYAAAGAWAAEAIGQLDARDSLLYTLASYGLLEVPKSMRDTALVAVGEYYVLSDEVVTELLLQVRSYVGQLTMSLVPSLLIASSATNALLGVSAGIRFGRRAAQRRAVKRNEEILEIPDLSMPPLREWHLPRPWGLRIGVLAVGYVLMHYAANDTLYMLGALMWQVFMMCFGVQGLAAFNASQHRRGTSRFWRWATVAAALLLHFMQVALAIVGVADQMTNARGLRPPLRPRGNEEE
ncbi:MAG: DUF2232 domain-containing protein [Clostridia bacterium]|nr:DUF2232 domain-containing protein [Clostridia bacterium]